MYSFFIASHLPCSLLASLQYNERARYCIRARGCQWGARLGLAQSWADGQICAASQLAHCSGTRRLDKFSWRRLHEASNPSSKGLVALLDM